MCGICGYRKFDGSPAERPVVERMVVALSRRGPDSVGHQVKGSVGLGHARLSIIDPAGGRQPLENEDGTVTVVANGEIYNYRELRTELFRRGHRFTTRSDCETIVHLWEEYGTSCVDHLRGMFAFVLYDSRHDTIFGARDRFGQKPLFFHHGGSGFAFASEIKGLLPVSFVPRKLDADAVDQMLSHQFVSAPQTLWHGIQKLPAGYSFTLHGDSTLLIHRYWETKFDIDESRSDDEHLKRIETGLDDAVRSHLVADVPVGVFLSGGIDSSLIAALATRHTPTRLQTFAISFPGSRHNEGPFAAEVACQLGTDHRDIPFAPVHLQRLFEDAAVQFDQPIIDSAVFPLMILSQHAVESVKVVLTGDGGDELFAGYRKYRRLAQFPGNQAWLSRALSRMVPQRWLTAPVEDRLGLRKFLARTVMSLAPVLRSEYQQQGWEGWERFKLYRPEFAELVFQNRISEVVENLLDAVPLNNALSVDQGPVLADRLLHKADYATMAFGIEARAPFLDHHLAELANRLPSSLKATASETKVVLRMIARKLLPTGIADRRKKGFSMPLGEWFRGELKEWTHDTLLSNHSACTEFFQRAAIERLLVDHTKSGKDHSLRIHSLLAFELWSRQYQIASSTITAAERRAA